ncbi:uncharacterized protein LOC124277686 [Haliotis rubra]|uniref:uncharacterized protein LOC124277686 n=1 Tax=Haliotis rubra TaxID=36100 RepID=UPI001EE5BDF7|nr:uncharacterized protein LOC124277686 [Haliotis rubra]XP_046569381.1 uncharacterized protein LOC124277686 [Haliotis rubra]
MNVGEAVRSSLDTVYTQPPFPPVYMQSQGQYQQNLYHQSQQTQHNPDTAAILAELEQMDAKLAKLDAIEHDVSSIKANMARLELKVQEIDGIKTRITEVEASTRFISDGFDRWNADKAVLEADLQSLRGKVDACAPDISRLKEDHLALREYTVDLRCRSMRDNLIFTGIRETEPQPTLEHCENVLKGFIKEHLQVDCDIMKFKRVHRIGAKQQHGGTMRPRALIAKFIYT